MKFMLMIKADDQYERGAAPDPKLMAAIGKLTPARRARACRSPAAS